VSELGRIMFVRVMESSKQLGSIIVSELGRIMFVRNIQS
jgi:hypothetical protein